MDPADHPQMVTIALALLADGGLIMFLALYGRKNLTCIKRIKRVAKQIAKAVRALLMVKE